VYTAAISIVSDAISNVSTVFTWLNASATINLVLKIGAATIQTRSSFDTGK